MLRSRFGTTALQLLLLMVPALLAGDVAAQTVWNERTISFSRPDGVDGLSPQYQDFITPNAIFARSGQGGLFNSAYEGSFLGGTSPEFTEWATALNNGEEANISAGNYAALEFTDFASAYFQQIGHLVLDYDAVVHLILDDVYFDIHFTSWTTGHESSQPGFAYVRGAPPAPETTGDYNGNHVVDAADYTIWRDTLGLSADPPGSGADGMPDGIIDELDYAFWKEHFGENVPGGSGGLAATNVPEPASWFLLIGGALILGCARK